MIAFSTFSFAQADTDWANLKKYQADNARLANPNRGESRIVFLGDSITEFWFVNDSTFFTSNSYIDRGISGQTSSHMLLRFRQDVIALAPKAVVILAGTNDIAENAGPISHDAILDNIKSMVELARLHGIKVVLCTVLPATDFWWRKGLEPAQKIVQLNTMIRAYATTENIPLVDYFAAMVNAENGLDKRFGADGVHPNLDGYRVMEPLVHQGIAKALR